MDQNRYCESVGFCFLLIVAEIILRSVWTVRSCIKFECDFSRIAGDRATFIGFTRFDELLGYVPREGFSGVINAPGWVNGKVTIRSDGFRSNGPEPPLLAANVLVVGDSFTFGDQVSDNETWPACLERKLGPPCAKAASHNVQDHSEAALIRLGFRDSGLSMVSGTGRCSRA